MAVKASGSVTVASITDVASTTRWYLLQSSTLSAPSKPTASPPGGSWAAKEPTYTEGSTNSLYTCDETTFSDGTWAYSSVSLSSSYEASKTAYNEAVAAQTTANSLSRLIRETEDGVDVGKSSDGTTYADGTSVTRQGTDGSFSILKMLSGVLTSVAAFGEDVIELGKNSTSAIIRMCGGKVSVSATADGKGRFIGTLSGDYGARIHGANGAASLGVDGFQDSISMVSGYLQVDDGVDALSQVSMRRFLTAIQPVMLYNGGAALDYDTAPGAGTTGTVTLSEDVSHFVEVDLCLVDNNGRPAGVFTLAPMPGHTTVSVGETCDVYGFEAADAEYTSTLIRRTRYTLATSTTLVPSNGGYVQLNSASGVSFSADGVNYLKIYRVTGRR